MDCVCCLIVDSVQTLPVVGWAEIGHGTSLLTHAESSLNRGQTGMWRFVEQRSRWCHSHFILLTIHII